MGALGSDYALDPGVEVVGELELSFAPQTARVALPKIDGAEAFPSSQARWRHLISTCPSHLAFFRTALRASTAKIIFQDRKPLEWLPREVSLSRVWRENGSW
jgi:hypothetical protein